MNRRRAEKHLVRSVSTFVDRVSGDRIEINDKHRQIYKNYTGSKFLDSVEVICGSSDRQTLPEYPSTIKVRLNRS
jgi:hypothetical protein